MCKRMNRKTEDPKKPEGENGVPFIRKPILKKINSQIKGPDDQGLKELWQFRFFSFISTAAATVGLIAQLLQWRHDHDLRTFYGYLVILEALVILSFIAQTIVRKKGIERVRELRHNFSNYLVLFPVKSNGNVEFYNNWLHDLADAGREENRPIYLTPVYPSTSFENEQIKEEHRGGLSILEQLKSIGNEYKHFDGVFAIVNNPDDETTKKLLKRYHKVFNENVMLLDMNFRNVITEKVYPRLDFVGSDEAEGGKAAARIASTYWQAAKRNKRPNRVVILEPHEDSKIPEGERRWDYLRISEFKKKLKDEFNEVDFVHITNCKYSQEMTRKELDRFVPVGENLDDWWEGVDFIFATNDESALAAKSFLDDHLGRVLCEGCGNCEDKHGRVLCEVCGNGENRSEHNHFNIPGPRIIGYDGSDSFFANALSEYNVWLIGTVDVKQKLQAKHAIQRMEDAVHGRGQEYLFEPIPPTPWMPQNYYPSPTPKTDWYPVAEEIVQKKQ